LEINVIDWALALSTASHAFKFANDLRSIDKEVSEADLKLKVADLTGTLADLKMILTEARDDAAEKDEEIARLKKLQRRVEDETVEQYGYRYRKRKDGKGPAAGNPMCDVCFQKDGLLIETATIAGKGIQALQCPNCKGRYDGLRTYTD
jgi:rubrerythrin